MGPPQINCRTHVHCSKGTRQPVLIKVFLKKKKKTVELYGTDLYAISGFYYTINTCNKYCPFIVFALFMRFFDNDKK